MENTEEEVVRHRAHTDASLDAERHSSDSGIDRAVIRRRRALDDLIERDRKAADERLLSFREEADDLVARERALSPAADGATADARSQTDEAQETARAENDEALRRERARRDIAVAGDRREQDRLHARLRARRSATDAQLSTERSTADLHAAASLDENARRSDVLAMVAHDLRSPLCVISLAAEAIAEQTSAAPVHELVEEVTLATARMERLLIDLLDVIRVESGALRVTKRRHDVRSLVSEVSRSYQKVFADRGITLATPPSSGALYASFDPDRIVQVLSNLLGNALKFTPAGGIVELRAEPGEAAVEVVVRDNGPGIHPDVVGHVFERFFQIDHQERRGLGLGLYISQQIIEAHGGTIRVESDFGHGATFRFSLPAG